MCLGGRAWHKGRNRPQLPYRHLATWDEGPSSILVGPSKCPLVILLVTRFWLWMESWYLFSRYLKYVPALSVLYIICSLKILLIYYTVLYCTLLYCILLYCIVLYCIVKYCIVLYCIILYCIVL